MTTSTSRPASAAPTASAWPGRKPRKPNSSRSAPRGSVARATGSGGGGPRPGRASVEAASMGRWTLPPAPEVPGPPRGVVTRSSLRRRAGTPPAPAAAKVLASARVEPAQRYLAELARRLRDLLGDALLGVYAGGSYALG